MTKTLINTKISIKELTLKPGISPVLFEVHVVNYSDCFASFQLEVLAAGADENTIPNWYTISPEVSTKKPPGDSTQFIVKIIDSPLPSFVGQMNLTVRVFSIELQEETRQLLRLIVEEGVAKAALKLTLPVQEFQVYPQQQLRIPFEVSNLSFQAANVVVKLTGIDPTWLLEEQQVLHIASHANVNTAFICQVPELTQANSQIYPFTITATLSEGISSHVTGNLSVLPQGIVEFRASPQEHIIPTKQKFFWRSASVNFQLEFENRSNIRQICQINCHSSELMEYEFTPQQIELNSGEINQMDLVTKVKRPWFGGVRQLLIELTAELSDQRLNVISPKSQHLKLKVLPLIPTWLILGSGGLLLWFIWSISCFNPKNSACGHHNPVNSVQLDGLAKTVISGSNDQTIAYWRVAGFFNPFINQFTSDIGNAEKAVRVVRYRPVDNNIMAAGLENGEIQLWSITGSNKFNKLIDTFSEEKDDRIFALEFTQDSRTLFSGHGSGFVKQWDTSVYRDNITKGYKRFQKKRAFKFAVYALKFVGNGNTNLAVAGRYNQFYIWNLASDHTTRVPYPSGGQDDYILSIDVAGFAPHILATGDNQGNITIWNMRSCLNGSRKECEIIDKWQVSKIGVPVRSVSIADNACYLASGGDDGKVTLWFLDAQGKRARNISDGQVIKKELSYSDNGQKFNSVNLKVVSDNILIASGSDDTQVRVDKEERRLDLGCDSRRNLPL